MLVYTVTVFLVYANYDFSCAHNNNCLCTQEIVVHVHTITVVSEHNNNF